MSLALEDFAHICARSFGEWEPSNFCTFWNFNPVWWIVCENCDFINGFSIALPQKTWIALWVPSWCEDSQKESPEISLEVTQRALKHNTYHWSEPRLWNWSTLMPQEGSLMIVSKDVSAIVSFQAKSDWKIKVECLELHTCWSMLRYVSVKNTWKTT